jgi:hypothetical protein
MPIKDEIQNWEKSLNDIDQLYVEREELRKLYDHYDRKMEKLVRKRFEMINKKITETLQEEKKFDRVYII